MDSCLRLMFLSYMVKLITSDSVSVRLVNGKNPCVGRVEVFNNGQWGTVCDMYWDIADAAVVCRELDCGTAVKATYNAHFGQGSGPISMGFVECSGSETALKDCHSNSQLAQQYCVHNQDAGVVCSEQGLQLVDGSHLCSGRVEMLRTEGWGSVCDAAFDQQDAEVVCRELDCGAPVQVLGAAAFGKGKGRVWSEEIQCRGNESQLDTCPRLSSQMHSCFHDNDVGVICSGYRDLRLVNGSDSCSGRVELQYLGEWGTVCDACWDMRAASVLCRQLNCGIAVSVVGSDCFGEGSGEIWADVFDCDGNETKLSECSISSWSRAECSHRRDVGVICSVSSLALHDGLVRLSGERQCDGEVEVFIHQVWRRVLLDSWSLTESSVVCRQLGCGSVLNFNGSSSSSPEHSHECVTGFWCSGSEAHLGNCSSPQTLNCSSTQQLSITCLGENNNIWADSSVVSALITNSLMYFSFSEYQFLGPSGWWVLGETVQGGWRFFTATHGAQCVMTPGILKMPMWCADSCSVEWPSVTSTYQPGLVLVLDPYGWMRLQHHTTAQNYGDREGTPSVHLSLSWPRHINSWERDIMSWPRDINSWERHIMSWPRDHFVEVTTSLCRGHEML
ncbi:hypothetical protein M9458_055984 [Cirrhinus mrigala]|uniref:SRCR domain-containing protein n=1 Tax=Cirrhinus mrigala TaxID=683832 RepID=A0ABD0MI01_CIRMR